LTPSNLISAAIKDRFPTAIVRVTQKGTDYAIAVWEVKLNKMTHADRVAEVYEALDKVPLTLLARVVEITCHTSR